MSDTKDPLRTQNVGYHPDAIDMVRCIESAAYNSLRLAEIASEERVMRAADYDIDGSALVSDGFSGSSCGS